MIRNIIANYFGRFWSVFSNIIFIPLYIHLLGIDGYSIISFSLVLVGLMAILDAGLTATLSKEFASLDNSLEIKQKIFQTLETIYLIIAVLVLIFFFFFSNFIASNWLNLGDISSYNTSQYLNIIGIGVAFQLLSQFYWGGLMGLEKQVRANVYQIGLGIVRNGLVVVPLIYFPNLYCFFIWQTASMIIYTVVVRQSLVILIFKKNTKNIFLKFEKSIIKKVWRFAAGIMLISLVAAINTQMDKLAISKFLPIQNLGYYTLAVTLTQGLLIIVNPIGSAIFPRLTALYSLKKTSEAVALFYKVFLLSNILVFSFASNMIFNADNLIWIWTSNRQLAIESSPFIPFLALGVSMLSLQIIPYYISLANGYTKYNNYIGIISIIITLPGYWIMTKYFGALGASIVWGVVQTITTPFYIYLVNKKFINSESFFYLTFKKIISPIFISILIAFVMSCFNSFNSNRFVSLLWIGFSTLVTIFSLIFIFFNKSQIKNVLQIQLPSKL